MIKEKQNYPEKLESYLERTLWGHLRPETRAQVQAAAQHHRFTFQEFRRMCEIARDLEICGSGPWEAWWTEEDRSVPEALAAPERKTKLLKRMDTRFLAFREQAKKYPADKTIIPRPKRDRLEVHSQVSGKKIAGDCPVASPETVCCNLKTIDAVENCSFGCSYCTIQTFYGDKAVFDAELAQKLKKIEIDPARFYHYGTGQSSDSLIWGNRNGILDDLCAFAAAHPNVLLEFKTKSDNIAYFQTEKVPANIVCSWSLNTDAVVDNEEHFTATLERRIRAARAVADRGIRVAFHFHPMVYYDGWEKDYTDLAARVQRQFRPEEVLFLSMGSVTFIKPVLQQIRRRGEPGKILQMNLVPAPNNKFSYPNELKIRMFRAMYETFSGWQDKVFMYLCMESAEIWDAVFGGHYPTNDEFEKDFGEKTMKKIPAPANRNE